VPGCTSRRNLHDHHIRFRSAGGPGASGNRITLCAFHHQRRLRGGLLRVSGRAPDVLLFELGLRAGASPLASRPSPVRRERAPATSGGISAGDGRLARRAVRQILRLPALRLAILDAELAERAAGLAADRALREADAVYVALAARLGLPLVTLDRERRRRADGVVEVKSVE
jgi:hypothetical protein